MKPLLLIVVACAVLSGMQSFAADPIAVGDRTCLFLDDRFVAEQSGFKRTWHQGKPQPQPAIVEGGTWERWPHMFGSVIRDPKDGLYKMYYESAISPRRQGEGRTASFTCYICYAESKDGKTWTKPELGLFDDLGSKENNIVVTDAELAKVIVDPLETDPSKRLKMFVYLQRPYPYPGGGQGECLLSSGDGLRWKFEGGFNKPAYANPALGQYTDSQYFLWDPLSQLYRAYIRTYSPGGLGLAEKKDGRRRGIGVSSSKLVNKDWTPIEHVMAADERDDATVAKMSHDTNKPDWAELYVMPFFNYGNHYLGLLSILYFIDGSDSSGGGDLQLTFSHDAKTWHRHPERQTLIGPSNASPELFPTYIQMNEPLDLGDEMWVYYTEANGAHPVAPPKKAVSQIRAATWRKDGFVSMDAAGKAKLTTKPVVFDGKELHVNFKGESLRVSLLDETGKVIRESQLLKGDSVAQTVKWKGKGDLSAWKGKPIQLRFELAKGQLWSFRFAK